MAFTKLTTESNVIQGLADHPALSASALKEKFDKYGDVVHDYLDAHIDELEATTAAGNIGFDNDDTQLTSTTIQGALEELDTVARQSAAGVVSDNSISAAKLQADCVITEKIYDGAVTVDKLGYHSVKHPKIDDNAVQENNIQNGSVTEGKIASAAVTEGKIGTGAVTSGKIASGAVTAAKTSFLPSTYYGNSLPNSGSEGQIFFLKV